MNKKIRKVFKKTFSLYLILGIVGSLISTLNIHFLQKILDHRHILWVVSYACTLLLGPIIAYVAEYSESYLEYGLVYFLKTEALKKVAVIDYQKYLAIRPEKLLQRIEAGATAGRNIYVHFYGRILRELVPEMCFTLLFVLFINPYLLGLILVGYMIIFGFTKLLLKFLYSLKETILNNEEELTSIFVRGLTELVALRVNKKYQSEIERYQQLSVESVRTATKMRMIHEFFFACFAILMAILKIVLVGLFFSGKLNLSLGSFVALLAYVDRIYQPIAVVNVLFVQYQLDQTAYQRLKEVYASAEDEKFYGDQQLTGVDTITIKNMSFSIEQQAIFTNFSAVFEKGKIYALVGKSGTGKSTLFRLLLGLFSVDSGEISYNQQSLHDLNIQSVYEKVSYISQDVPIFADTLRENICLGKDVSDEEIEVVLEKCQLLSFYQQLPDKLATKLEPHLETLSGGERQRIAFARLFFSEADVILLDEATSALDRQTAKRVLSELVEIFEHKIVLMITHKLDDLQFVDEVVYIEKP
ncbi:ABC transporter ATP-binding protein [Enterococcus saccharolyticus]|uniref:ABC transporter ATP-binding protein n=1 Tax=Enterococcus saccharolyticus TaxID=41997 RepID=UPI001E477327|nr:ABC transporter ATP-binding protein [Enterococcus saccharolyticus]MCD5000930.1 ABC transporter ATP-binding protein [Enterococcus saccharolyticus]